MIVWGGAVGHNGKFALAIYGLSENSRRACRDSLLRQRYAAPAPVDIPADGVTLHATLYRPDGDGPFPAVVALHDCGGLTHRPATQSQLYTEWANLLVAKGFVVLFPDSFGSRGLGSQCRETERKVHARRERVADANAARRWLQAQGYVKTDQISLLGWSNGGSAALWTVRPTTKPKDGSRISVPRSRSIRVAGDCAKPHGARGFRH